MSIKTIDGRSYVRMLEGGAAKLAEHASELNDLNVFPVADGDTGTNMMETFDGGLSSASENADAGIGEVSKLFAGGTLLSARGNSGVILSQIFTGISEGLAPYESVGAKELAEAYEKGIEKSYAAVRNPTEGTILTVFRESTEYAAENIDETSDADEFYRLHTEMARRSLERTKEILPALAEADVVDSGAAGYLQIAEGMYETLLGAEISYSAKPKPEKAGLDIDSFTRKSVLEHGYCTEFLLRLTEAKTDPDTFDINAIISTLESLGGESVVAYKQDDIVKVHVHTFIPGEVLSAAQKYGEFLTVKVENMSVGHSGEEVKKAEKKKKYAVVAVASGEGISALFSDMGADVIISGGQTANPSTEEFIEAFGKCNAENIIVLPNNKNIFLAAKQAADMYKEADVHIVETKNLMQGYGALSVITPGITDIDSLVGSAGRAAANVTDCEVTPAVRDAVIDGKNIKKGDYIAISLGEIAAVAESAEEAVMQMLEEADTDLCEIITVFTGKNVSEEKRVALTEALEEAYEDCEITVYEGGQEVYDYLIAIE